jgi:hypothetical protein
MTETLAERSIYWSGWWHIYRPVASHRPWWRNCPGGGMGPGRHKHRARWWFIYRPWWWLFTGSRRLFTGPEVVYLGPGVVCSLAQMVVCILGLVPTLSSNILPGGLMARNGMADLAKLTKSYMVSGSIVTTNCGFFRHAIVSLGTAKKQPHLC